MIERGFTGASVHHMYSPWKPLFVSLQIAIGGQDNAQRGKNTSCFGACNGYTTNCPCCTSTLNIDPWTLVKVPFNNYLWGTANMCILWVDWRVWVVWVVWVAASGSPWPGHDSSAARYTTSSLARRPRCTAPPDTPQSVRRRQSDWPWRPESQRSSAKGFGLECLGSAVAGVNQQMWGL